MRLDLAWDSGPQVRESVWAWRHETTQQVVNPDIDGLLTACLLHHLKGWPVVGFYDTQRLLLDPAVAVPLDLRSVVWVDVDMCWPGAGSLSQHVVLDVPGDLAHVGAYRTTVNPSLLRLHSRRGNYRDKYPFGTFQWAWWLAGHKLLLDPHDRVMNGLAWMADGGFDSVRGVWRENCLDWALRQMPGSILEPLARRDPSLAAEAVRAAEAELVGLSGVRRGWRNHQFNLTSGSHTGPRLNFPLDEAPQVLQAVCDAICTLYGWRPLLVPQELDLTEGTWRTGAGPPPGWPHAANEHRVVSLAVTGRHQVCWTEPGDLGEVLGNAPVEAEPA